MVAPRPGPLPALPLPPGALMPSGRESEMWPGHVKIVVHPPIPAKGNTADSMCDKARAAVASALPPALVASSSEMAPDE